MPVAYQKKLNNLALDWLKTIHFKPYYKTIIFYLKELLPNKEQTIESA